MVFKPYESVESSVLEKGALETVLKEREVSARGVWPLSPALIGTILETRTAVGKGLLTRHFRTYALTVFLNSRSCIYTLM